MYEKEIVHFSKALGDAKHQEKKNNMAVKYRAELETCDVMIDAWFKT